MEQDIFYENGARVTKTAVKALRWLILVFTLLIILSAVGIFQAKIGELLLLTVIALVVTMGPGIAYKMNMPKGIEVIGHSARQTEDMIDSLENGMKEISEFANTIAGITNQTNLFKISQAGKEE